MTTDHDHISLESTGSDPGERAAWTILQQAQVQHQALSIARACADYGGYHAPRTPGEYLYWIHDQAQVQQEVGDSWQEETSPRMLEAYRHASALWRIALEVAKLGIQETPPTRKGEVH